MPDRWVPVAAFVIMLTILSPAKGRPLEHGRDTRGPWVTTAQLKITFNLQSGVFDCNWTNGCALNGAACEIRLAKETTWSSAHSVSHQCDAADIVPFEDQVGSGIAVTVHHVVENNAELRQRFWIYQDQAYFITSLDAVGAEILRSNDISPIKGATLGLREGSKPRVLFVPFDNDAWVRYNDPKNPTSDPSSYEVTAIYDNSSRNGFIVGSVSHDIWKTGIDARTIANDRISQFRVYGGATGKLTGDSQPHGMVSGNTITSPKILVGNFTDWRDGLETFGRINALFSPSAKWMGGVPFGWNSWAAYGMDVTPARMTHASDFMKQQIQPHFDRNTPVYINWDSGWNRYTDKQLRAVTDHIHANGQKMGIYLAPFGYWGEKFDSEVEDTNGRYRYADIVLKDSAANPLPKIDNAHALDPTHPGTHARIDAQLKRIVDSGADFIKLDFLNFAALEGAHFDPKITTGIAAYRSGMEYVLAALDPKKLGRPMFVSLSIAPLFPSYGHSRRVSCDVYGELKESEYLLNSLTYGWWIGGSVYCFNDPDHIVLHDKAKNKNDAVARTRVNASVIAGGLFLDSDDLENHAAQERARRLLTNLVINEVARSGQAFRPVEGDSGAGAADVFVGKDGNDGALVAVFNFNATKQATKTVELDRLGLAEGKNYRVRDLWTQRIFEARQKLSIDLAAGESTILRLTEQ